MSLPDIVDLLLPEGGPDERERARRLTTALRLLLHASRGRRAGAADSGLDQAQREFESLHRERRIAALTVLLHHHLVAHQGAERLVPFGAPRTPVAEAWRRLIETAPTVEPPAAAELPLDVARRLLARLAAECGGGGAPSLLQAWFDSAEQGPQAGRRAFGALVDARGPQAQHLAAVAGVAACLLDQGRCGEAREVLEDHLEAAALCPRLGWMLVWSQLLSGDEAAARGSARGLSPFDGVLSTALAEVRGRRPEWLALLPGREPPAGEPTALAVGRSDLGASVLAVFALAPGAGVEVVSCDLAPGLAGDDGGPPAAWLRRLDGATLDPACAEHRLATRAAPVLLEADSTGPPPGGLDPRRRILALEPIRFPRGPAEGEVAGWVHLECSHHLLPSARRRRALAEAWRERVLEVAWRRRGPLPEVLGPPETAAQPDPGDPRGRAFSDWMEALGWKLAQRRWWGFALEEGQAELVAEGGRDLAGWRGRPGRGLALVRAAATGGQVTFGSPEPRLSIHAEAASGCVVPLRTARGPAALLAVESRRRRDFETLDPARLAESLARFGPAWSAARLRAWHLETRGFEVHVDPAWDYPVAAAEIEAVARSRAPVALVGAPGSGRRTVAHWVHAESGGLGRAPRQIYAGRGSTERLQLRGETTWLIEGLEAADPAWQSRFVARWRALGPDRPRLMVLLTRPVEEAGLHPDLAAPLARLQLTLPPLCGQRNAIGRLTQHLTERLARAEGLEPPTWRDGALGLLWRQPWSGGPGQLEAVVSRVVLRHPGVEVGPQEVRAAAAAAGLVLVPKLSPRHPSPRDLVAALRLTRCSSGAPNKTRAAAYLGWDPATLTARLREMGIDAQRALEAKK